MPKKDDAGGGKAPTMEYGTGLSDHANFVKYLGQLGTFLIMERGPSSYLMKKPDFDAVDEMWGLSADPHHPSKTRKNHSEAVRDYWKSQALLLDTLMKAFARDAELLEDFQAEGLTEKYIKEHNLAPADTKLQWLPFGSLALHALEARYKDSPGNSMLHLCHVYEKKLGNCDSNNLGAFARDMESAGGKYLAAIKDLSPEHMLVLQMLSALRGTTNTDCVAFVQDFTVKNECKLYTLPEFLTKLRTFIQNLAAQNIGKSNGAAATVNMTVSQDDTGCAIKGCGNRLLHKSHKYCKTHFLQQKNRNKNSDQPDLPAPALEKMKDKMREKQKKRFAKEKKKKKKKPAEAATAIRDARQANSVVARVPAATPSVTPVTADTASTSKKRKASDAAVESSVLSSPKKRKFALRIAKTGIKTALLKKTSKTTTSAKNVKVKSQTSVRKKIKDNSTRAANAVIAALGHNETMITPRFANAHPYGLSSFESSYALCEAKKKSARPIA